ncbi:hypothetical protein CKM354_000889300 [Cercospora kikuchii]|uniref:Rhodopsin domain-containing protein n=1 Tax=Cercospora kikuchii TaxID=84275 RepID=A0A9P3CMW6_9PEZI|nr:uncharacterized protein CKM354_000889300 [Cercospora kikuchii]GIZ45739.1 hypothetical protein CKM354_000889300 [Cercospora kikuchii]
MATQHEFLYPPLSTITPTDRRGIYWIIGVICVCHILLTLFLRLMVRWRRFQIDDYAVVAGCVLFLAQTGVAFGAVALHLGSADGGENESRASTAWHLFLASEALYVVGLYAAKLAVLLAVQSLLARDMAVRIVFHCTLGAVTVLGIASLLTVLVGCDGHDLLTGGGDNCNRETRWIAVAIMDALTELWGFALFCWVVWSLQMRSSYKITASAMVGLRLLCIIFAAMHADRVEQFVNSSRPSTIVIRPLTWQTLGLTYSLFSAMAIALRPFLKDFHTGMGMDLGHAADYGSGSRKITKESFKMQNMSPEGTRDQKGGNTEDIIAASSPAESTVFTPEDQNYVAEIYHANRKASNGSMRSEDPIIRKQVDYDVTYER